MKYDKQKYKIWDWKSPVILHWMINPGLIINELIIGQTIPKIMLIEREGEKPFYQRTYIPCPHCETLHNGMKWSVQNKTALKNWYGLYCDNCGEIIPPQRNLSSLLIMIITFPLWGWFRKSWKEKWLSKQAVRFEHITYNIPEKKNTTANWLKNGLLWGVFMYVSMTFVFPIIAKEQITQRNIIIGIPIWAIGGLILGYFLKQWMNRKGKMKSTS